MVVNLHAYTVVLACIIIILCIAMLDLSTAFPVVFDDPDCDSLLVSEQSKMEDNIMKSSSHFLSRFCPRVSPQKMTKCSMEIICFQP